MNQEFIKKMLSGNILSVKQTIVSLISVVVFVLVAPLILNQFQFRILFLIVMWGGLALSWNIVGGFIDYPSFGHVAFFGLGSFTVGLGAKYANLGDSFGPELVLTLFLSGLIPTIFAALIAYPTLQLRGAYFGVTTLGIALAISELFSNLEILGGGFGVASPTFSSSILSVQESIYYLLVAAVGMIIIAIAIIRQTRLGYGFAAIRANESAAEMIGIPTTQYKIIAFVLSAFFPGVIGGLYAYYLGYFTASAVFSLQIGLNMIIYAVIGGIGTIGGPLIGAALMVILRYVVLSGSAQAHVLLTGLFLVFVLLFFPSGIHGLIRSIVSNEQSSLANIRALWADERKFTDMISGWWNK